MFEPEWRRGAPMGGDGPDRQNAVNIIGPAGTRVLITASFDSPATDLKVEAVAVSLCPRVSWDSGIRETDLHEPRRK